MISTKTSLIHTVRTTTTTTTTFGINESKPKVRKLAIRVNVDLASLPGPPCFLNYSWVEVSAGRITGADIAAWPYSVSFFIRFTSFLNTLHWPSGSDDFGHFGISFLELLNPIRAMGWTPIAW